jgi:hypothetical protein
MSIKTGKNIRRMLGRITTKNSQDRQECRPIEVKNLRAQRVGFWD